MSEKRKNILHNVRQGTLVTLVLLLLCGFLFPAALSGLSAVFFPSQSKGSLVTADGIAVGATNVGQEFTEDYFLWGRPSAYHYNTYYEEDTDGDGQVEQYYNDGTEFAGLGSGSNNYAPSNPALITRVESSIVSYLTQTLAVTEDLPENAFAALPGAKDAVEAQIACVAESAGISSEELETRVFSTYTLLSAAGLAAETVGDTSAEGIAAAAGITVDELYESAAASVSVDDICQAANISEEQTASIEVPTLYELQKSYVAEAAGLPLEEVDNMVEAIPTDLMTASGSGLDPHISPASAELQVSRIAEASGLNEEQVRAIIAENTQGKWLGVFGEETVNVLGVNLDIAQAMGLVSETAHS